MNNPLGINKGDRLTIVCGYHRITGNVHTVKFTDVKGWYVLLTEANVPGGGSFWRSEVNGGRIVSINGMDAVDIWQDVRNETMERLKQLARENYEVGGHYMVDDWDVDDWYHFIGEGYEQQDHEERLMELIRRLTGI